MKNKLLLYILVSFVLVLSLLVSLSSSVFAATRASSQKEDYTFLDMHNLANRTYMSILEKDNNPSNFGLYWLYNARKYNTVNMDFTKDFWMPIQPWEYEVCSRGLSTQLTYENGAGVGSTFSSIYDDTVTVAAYKRTPVRNLDADASMLYEISWYFHPAKEGKYYDIKLISRKTSDSKVIQTKAGANTKSGDSGYVAFYSATDYDTVVLTDESTPKEYRFAIINTTDADR